LIEWPSKSPIGCGGRSGRKGDASMRTHSLVRPLVAGLLVAALVGCASSKPKRSVIVSEPPLLSEGLSPIDGGTEIAQAPEIRSDSFVDRHPFFTRPREYYDSTNGNKLTRTAAAAVIGVPSGIGAEIKQVFTGGPVSK